MMLVESYVPPIPTSMTATSTCRHAQGECEGLLEEDSECEGLGTVAEVTYLLLEEDREGHDCEKPKVGWHAISMATAAAAQFVVHVPEICHKARSAQRTAIDTNSLPNFQQMRRSVEYMYTHQVSQLWKTRDSRK